jgi:hypothetical protein
MYPRVVANDFAARATPRRLGPQSASSPSRSRFRFFDDPKST